MSRRDSIFCMNEATIVLRDTAKQLRKEYTARRYETPERRPAYRVAHLSSLIRCKHQSRHRSENGYQYGAFCRLSEEEIERENAAEASEPANEAQRMSREEFPEIVKR